MVHNQLTIVCYTGGTCGDLITALIDSRDVWVDDKSVRLPQIRQYLKKPHQFANDQEKDQYICSISKQYLSIPSHDFEYHKKNNHSIITIEVDTDSAALWAAKRFKQLHRDHVWQQMIATCGADSVQSYAQIMIDFSKMAVNCAQRSIKLTDIINGRALDVLESWPEITVAVDAKTIYNKWLQQVPPIESSFTQNCVYN
jgi:hypothetical protein